MMMTRNDAYEAPEMTGGLDDELEILDAEVPVFVAAIGWVLLVFGSVYAFCAAVCGPRNIRSCGTSGWLKVKAVCKR